MSKKRITRALLAWAVIFMLPFLVAGQEWQGKFEQLGNLLPSPNSYRTASGQPGKSYWQVRANYKIEATLDEEKLVLSGYEEVTFFNDSPHELTYLWFQLDQNVRSENSMAYRARDSEITGDMEAQSMMDITGDYFYEGGYKIIKVSKPDGSSLEYTINETMMRIEIPSVLKPGEQFTVAISWKYNLYDRQRVDGRGGYEYFPKEDNYLFSIAQWYPRLAVYDDVEGWQNKQFMGMGEFALTFGDFDVKLTVPSDHIVAATGELKNKEEVLSKNQLSRLVKAKTADEPVFIVTEKEARKNEKTKSSENKTWNFKAENVRDFAFATSRKFIWDAMAVEIGDNRPMAMSFYPKEGNPLWERESTKAVVNTLISYSNFTIDYPYPVAISVHAAEQGMEYPMICFNYGRPDAKGRYSQRELQGMISVIVHEVGHNYFPMIINSDERQWTWMDEGLNTFLEQRTIDKYYPSLNYTYGTPASITSYMRGNPAYIRPLMTNSEQIIQFSYNGYGKPSAALHVLRDVVMGPELFDYAFKTYAQRWAFKRPMPADFFRTMEDASAVDLDWFWRGWFFTVDYVDLEIYDVTWYQIENEFKDISKGIGKMDDIVRGNILDKPNKISLVNVGSPQFTEFMNTVDHDAILEQNAGKNLYEITFVNRGGLVSPLILEWTYNDGSKETELIPAEVWRLNELYFTKVFAKEKEVASVQLDPEEKTGDVYIFNNSYPRKSVKNRFDTFKSK